ncbi:hypothetical protein PG2009B_0902 [Bifidobacterium pseudolongum subsp. globosum]|nr:hypothetical protein PG2009B_0902 [Bifidobacterium pseudolongum subsp. globosum]
MTLPETVRGIEPVRSAFRPGLATFCCLRLIRTLLVDQVNGVVVHDIRPVRDKRPASHRASKPERVRWNPSNHAQNLVLGGRLLSISVTAADTLKQPSNSPPIASCRQRGLQPERRTHARKRINHAIRFARFGSLMRSLNGCMPATGRLHGSWTPTSAVIRDRRILMVVATSLLTVGVDGIGWC